MSERSDVFITLRLSGPGSLICEMGIMKPCVAVVRVQWESSKQLTESTVNTPAVVTTTNYLLNIYQATSMCWALCYLLRIQSRARWTLLMDLTAERGPGAGQRQMQSVQYVQREA